MRTLTTCAIGLALLCACDEYPGAFGVSSEIHRPDELVDGTLDLAGVEVLFQINANIHCAGSDPVWVCVDSTAKQWCGGAACVPHRFVNAVLNFADNDLPIRPTAARLGGALDGCAGVWLVAIR